MSRYQFFRARPPFVNSVLLLELVIRNSQVLAKLGVVTIFSIRGIKRLKSQAIFKSIEKLSDSRILDIYLRVLKKEERTTGALEPSAGVPLMAMKGNIMWKSVLF